MELLKGDLVALWSKHENKFLNCVGMSFTPCDEPKTLGIVMETSENLQIAVYWFHCRATLRPERNCLRKIG